MRNRSAAHAWPTSPPTRGKPSGSSWACLLRTSQILPVIVGESEPALRIAEKLQSTGFDVRAIRPPTVPSGTARLRISITLHVDERSIDGLVHAMGEAMHVDAGVLRAEL